MVSIHVKTCWHCSFGLVGHRLYFLPVVRLESYWAQSCIFVACSSLHFWLPASVHLWTCGLLAFLSFSALLKDFIKNEILDWPRVCETYEQELRVGVNTTPTGSLSVDTEDGRTNWDALRKRVVEHVGGSIGL